MGQMKSWFFVIVGFLHTLVQVFARWIFKLFFGIKGDHMPPIKDILLLDSASTIAQKIRSKKVTSVQVVNSFIKRIKEINPTLNCVVADRFQDALKEAQAVDDLLKSGTITEDDLAKSKPFLGVPFTTKDCIAVKGMIHTGGLYKRRNHLAEEDAITIASLRNAGAIPIALTNVSELCMWWESYNMIHGGTSNPYDTNRIVGGSSGGEGCNQSASGAAFGIGSDIGGSIRMPAYFNGVFGHKPSKGIISNEGQYPAADSEVQNSMLSIGPLCRRAEDLLPILKIITKKEFVKEMKYDEKVDLKKIKYYYQDSNLGEYLVSPVQPEIKALFKKIVFHLQAAHKLKAQEMKIEKFKRSGDIWFADMSTADGPTFDQHLTDLEGCINIPFEFIKSCFRLSNFTFIGLLTAVVEKFSLKPGNPKHQRLTELRDLLIEEMKKLLGDDGVFIYPTHPTSAPYHYEPMFKPLNFTYTAIINALGFPATHCPMGLNSEGLPIGVQVISNYKNDRLCVAVAVELEKAFGGWVPPQVLV